MPGAIDPTLDRASLPRHIGIVMDGEARWAATHEASPETAQLEGFRAAWRVILAVRRSGISYLSLFPVSEFPPEADDERETLLLRAVRKHLTHEAKTFRREGIRIVHSGDLSDLSTGDREAVELLKDQTRNGENLFVNIALRSGGRSEIVRAVNRWLAEDRQIRGAAAARSGETITEEVLDSHLDLPYFPEPDLIIRSGGERRVSNFLLWESAYSEFVFSDHLWPDWSEAEITKAIEEYQRRTRRFGGA